MWNPSFLKRFSHLWNAWKEKLFLFEKNHPPRKKTFTTLSDTEVPVCLTELDLKKTNFDPERDLGLPGQYPFTRGVYPNLYRGKLWTFRQFSGFGSAKQTNQRFHHLLRSGQTGLSVAFDMPTLMGYDADHVKAKGEVGKCGVSVSSLEDMEALFEGIPLKKVSTSMTINGPAFVLLAMYLVVAEKQKVPKDQVRGTLQNDILKEYIAQKEWIFPIRPSVKLVTDTIEFCTRHYPKWNTVSVSGYHIREAGATAAQELAFTLLDGKTYVEQALKRGLDIDQFVPRLSFFFDVHNDFFEEIAKFRAARRIWARWMKETFGAQDPRSWMLRTHAQTAGVSLTAQQPMNNVVRVAFQALAGVLGGTNSLHTNSMDETLALPTQASVTLALRTQQILAKETGVANTVDPLGGSYFVEWMTHKIEQDALCYAEKIDQMGGMIAAIERGYPQSEIAQSAYRFQKQLEVGEKHMVGVNCYQEEEKQKNIETLYIDQQVEREQSVRLAVLKKKRSSLKVREALLEVQAAARQEQNVMESVMKAVRCYATLQELCDALREVYGEYQEEHAF